MTNIDWQRPTDKEGPNRDLIRRLARYRRRIEAEGRARSLQLIDQAIEDAGKKA